MGTLTRTGGVVGPGARARLLKTSETHTGVRDEGTGRLLQPPVQCVSHTCYHGPTASRLQSNIPGFLPTSTFSFK